MLGVAAAFILMFIVRRELLKGLRKAFDGGLGFGADMSVLIDKRIVPAAFRVVLMLTCSVASFAALLVFVLCVRWVGGSRFNERRKTV